MSDQEKPADVSGTSQADGLERDCDARVVSRDRIVVSVLFFEVAMTPVDAMDFAARIHSSAQEALRLNDPNTPGQRSAAQKENHE